MRTFLATTILLAAILTPGAAAADPSAGPAANDASSEEPVHHSETPLFAFDPVTDTMVITLAGSVALFSQITVTNEELPPTTPGATDLINVLDRWLVSSTPVGGAALSSDLVVGALVGWAFVGDMVGAWARFDFEHGAATFLLYLESVGITLALTNVVKIAVRRPRPLSYRSARLGREISGTDSSLSFFSGHTALASTIAATATYLAFARDGADSWIPWTTLALGVSASVAAGILRVAAMKHFPTDVMAGAAVGWSIGILVPHLHRVDTTEWRINLQSDQESTVIGVSGVF